MLATSNPESDEVEEICSTFTNLEHLRLHFPTFPRAVEGLPALDEMRALRSLELSGTGDSVIQLRA